MDPRRILSDGFPLGGRRESLSDLALLSLRQALRAYFSTYSAMRYSLHLFRQGSSHDQATIDFNHSLEYWDAASETVLHVQHFIELYIKSILRALHPLLADQASNDPIILYKLLHGESLDEAEGRGIKSLEFSRAFSSFCRLFEAGRVDQEATQAVYDARVWVEGLNGLRNRVWHRGAFVLRYSALDRLMGQYVLPFIESATAHPPYVEGTEIWRYPALECGVDPITEIIAACQEGSYDLGHVAFAKELGRAAYASPLRGGRFARLFDNLHRGRVERGARLEETDSNVSEVRKCSVCGCLSLVVFDDVEIEEEEDSGFARGYRYTGQVTCRMCSFEVNHHLANPSEYGFPFEDYWKGAEL